jgi:predicted nucleic acid-binding protein
VTVFFDTNILVYAQQQGPKAAIARRVLASGGTLSVQVLNEFAAVSHRKLGRSWEEIAEAVVDIRAVVDPPVALDSELHDAARALARSDGLSFYDALIVVAAQRVGATALLSEDMQNGRRFGDVTVINPFMDAE